MGSMKTTVEIQDQLLERAKRLSKRTGKPLRQLMEEGLRHVLQSQRPSRTYHLPDRSVGSAADPDPLAGFSWQDLRAEIYGAPR